MRERMKSMAWGGLGMLLVAGLLWVGLHAYQDHANLHALVGIVEQAQQRQAAPPTTASPRP